MTTPLQNKARQSQTIAEKKHVFFNCVHEQIPWCSGKLFFCVSACLQGHFFQMKVYIFCAPHARRGISFKWKSTFFVLRMPAVFSLFVLHMPAGAFFTWTRISAFFWARACHIDVARVDVDSLWAIPFHVGGWRRRQEQGVLRYFNEKFGVNHIYSRQLGYWCVFRFISNWLTRGVY